MTKQPKKARSTHQQDDLFQHSAAPRQASPTGSNECNVVAVGKRRDGGTRYWCLEHKADATAKYGKPASHCRAAHLPPITSADILDINLDRYQGGVAFWGAVPAVYDTTRLPMDRGIHVHTRKRADDPKEMDATVRAVRLRSGVLPTEGIVVSELDAIYYMATTVFGFPMKYVTCTYCGFPLSIVTISAFGLLRNKPVHRRKGPSARMPHKPKQPEIDKASVL